MKRINRIGRKYGQLTVIKQAGHTGKTTQHITWLCRCSCGTELIVSGSNLGRGTISCGCYKRGLTTRRNTTHGLTEVPEYAVWWNMIARCRYKCSDKNKRYVYRGIKVCDRWQDFKNFYDDMGKKPSPSHTLDRIDNDGNYEPGNVRWESARTQANNRSTNRLLTFKGESKTVAEWGRATGIPATALSKRLVMGWPIEKVLTLPSQK